MLNLTGKDTPRGIQIDHLCKHLFISGVPGSGKTTGTFSILLQLFERGIPFLVIETAKREYRRLKCLHNHAEPTARGLADAFEVYTADREFLSPVRFNPLWRPPDLQRDLHLDAVLRFFKASLPMFEPLPAVLGEALEAVLDEEPQSRTVPTLDDLYAACRRVLAAKRYGDEPHRNMSAALDVRLGTLTRRTVGALFRSRTCIPDIAHLATSYTLIEMDDLEGEVKCLLTLFLLTALHQHVRRQHSAEPGSRKHPRLVIVIEEAHNIVGRCADGPPRENQVDVKAAATELICRMLAEFRALGVGLILIDQLPSQMAPQVIKNTGAKLAFRQVDREDREMLADTMLFSALEYEEIARLISGQAYLYAEGYHRAHRLRTPHLEELLNLPDPPTDERLASLVRGQAWYQDAQLRRADDLLARFEVAMDRHDELISDASRMLKKLVDERTELVRKHGGLPPREARNRLAARFEHIGRQADEASRRLARGLYRETCDVEAPEGALDAPMEAKRQSRVRRFDDRVRAPTEQLREFITRTVAQLRNDV